MWRGAPKSALAVHSNYDNRVRPTCALFNVHTGTAQDHEQVKQTVDEMHERTHIEKTATETKEGLTWAYSTDEEKPEYSSPKLGDLALQVAAHGAVGFARIHSLGHTPPSALPPREGDSDMQEAERLFLKCSDYGIDWFINDYQRDAEWPRMVDCLALLHFTFGVAEAFVERYHGPLDILEDCMECLDISSAKQACFMEAPTADIRKMLHALNLWGDAVLVRALKETGLDPASTSTAEFFVAIEAAAAAGTRRALELEAIIDLIYINEVGADMHCCISVAASVLLHEVLLLYCIHVLITSPALCLMVLP